MTDTALPIAVRIIADFEGFRSHPYLDSGGVYTIGYGFTHTPDKRSITADTPPISQEDAWVWLELFVGNTLAAVREMVHAPITDNQAAALTSLAYNVGTQAVRGSSLMMALNQGRSQEAADAFRSWVYAGGRRGREWALFLTSAHEGQND